MMSLLLAIFSPSAQASPTLGGASGLIYMPTAESLRYKEFDMAVDSIYTNRAGTNQSSVFYKANLGTFKGLELGFVGGAQPNEGVFLNAKYYLLSDASKYPLGIALGMGNLSSASLNNFYMVASKRFPQNFDAHAGFQATFVNQTTSSIMAGVEFFPATMMSIAVDTIGDGSNYITNAGFRISLNNNVQVRIYGLNIFDGAPAATWGAELPSDPSFSLGLNWNDFIQ